MTWRPRHRRRATLGDDGHAGVAKLPGPSLLLHYEDLGQFVTGRTPSQAERQYRRMAATASSVGIRFGEYDLSTRRKGQRAELVDEIGVARLWPRPPAADDEPRLRLTKTPCASASSTWTRGSP